MKPKLISMLALIITVVSTVNLSAGSKTLDLTTKTPSNSIITIATCGSDALQDDISKTLISQITNDPQIQGFATQICNILKSQMNINDTSGFEKVKEICYAAKSHELFKYARVYGIISNTVERFDNGSWIWDGCIYTISEGGSEKVDKLNAFVKELPALVSGLAEFTNDQYQNDKLGNVNQFDVNINSDLEFTISIVQKNNYCISMISYKNYADKFINEISNSIDNPTKINAFDNIKLKGDDVLVNYNLKEYFKALPELMGQSSEKEKIQNMFTSMGIDSISNVYYRLGFDDKQVTLDVVGTDYSSFMGMLGKVDTNLLKAIPENSSLALCVNYKLSNIIDMYANMIRSIAGEDVINEIASKIEEFENESGVQLRDGLLYNITGESASGFSVNEITGLMGASYTEIGIVNDSALYLDTINKLVEFVKDKTPDMIQITVSDEELDGFTLHSVTIPQFTAFGIKPTFIAVDEKHIVFSTTSQTALEAVKRFTNDKKEGSILANEKFIAATKDAPKEMAYLQYTDSESLLKGMSTTANTYWPILGMMASSKDIVLPTTLPQITDKFDGLPASVTWSEAIDENTIHSYIKTDGLIYAAFGGAYGALVTTGISQGFNNSVASQSKSIQDQKNIGLALLQYSEEHDTLFPGDLSELAQYMECGVPRCNGISYVYRGGDLSVKDNDPQMIMTYCTNFIDNNRVTFLCLDGHCEAICLDGFISKIKFDIEKRKEAGLELKGVDGLIKVVDGEIEVTKPTPKKCTPIF